jgi:DNA repair exonuclease SbcCD ATPase subunit
LWVGVQEGHGKEIKMRKAKLKKLNRSMKARIGILSAQLHAAGNLLAKIREELHSIKEADAEVKFWNDILDSIAPAPISSRDKILQRFAAKQAAKSS